MKKFYMTMVAMLCGVAAMAQVTASLTVPESVEVKAGDTGAIAIGMDADGALCALSFRIGFPEGCGLYSYYDEDEEEIVFPKSNYVLGDRCYKDGEKVHSAAIQNTTEEGFVQVAITSNPVSNFVARTGDIITLNFNVGDDVKAGDYTITIKKAAASTKAGVSVDLADKTVTLKVTAGTGINGINAIDSKEPVYNLAGQRVNKAQKGVFIQNGKKVAVK